MSKGQHKASSTRKRSYHGDLQASSSDENSSSDVDSSSDADSSTRAPKRRRYMQESEQPGYLLDLYAIVGDDDDAADGRNLVPSISQLRKLFHMAAVRDTEHMQMLVADEREHRAELARDQESKKTIYYFTTHYHCTPKTKEPILQYENSRGQVRKRPQGLKWIDLSADQEAKLEKIVFCNSPTIRYRWGDDVLCAREMCGKALKCYYKRLPSGMYRSRIDSNWMLSTDAFQISDLDRQVKWLLYNKIVIPMEQKDFDLAYYMQLIQHPTKTQADFDRFYRKQFQPLSSWLDEEYIRQDMERREKKHKVKVIPSSYPAGLGMRNNDGASCFLIVTMEVLCALDIAFGNQAMQGHLNVLRMSKDNSAKKITTFMRNHPTTSRQARRWASLNGKSNRQQDCHEAFDLLLRMDENAYNQFNIRTVQTRKCGCQLDPTTQDMWCVDLYMPDRKSTSVEECLAEYQAMVKLDDNCMDCNMTTKRQIQISAVSRVFTLRLLRFGQYGNKKQHDCKFAMRFTLPLKHTGVRAEQVMTLCAVIVHEGNTIARGHFYCFLRSNRSNTWFRYDSSRAGQTPEAVDAEVVLRAEAYMLFYRVGEDSRADTEEEIDPQGNEVELEEGSAMDMQNRTALARRLERLNISNVLRMMDILYDTNALKKDDSIEMCDIDMSNLDALSAWRLYGLCENCKLRKPPKKKKRRYSNDWLQTMTGYYDGVIDNVQSIRNDAEALFEDERAADQAAAWWDLFGDDDDDDVEEAEEEAEEDAEEDAAEEAEEDAEGSGSDGDDGRVAFTELFGDAWDDDL